MKSVILTLVIVAIAFGSDQIPAPAQKRPILIKNGTLHTVSGAVLTKTDILFEGGHITRIEKNIIPNPKMEVFDAAGKHIYPGMIAATSILGLVEIGAVRATRDFNEVGNMTPEVRAGISYNPDSESIPVTRSNGVLLANVVPLGGLISGQSTLMKLDGWTIEDATASHPTALQLNWPNMRFDLRPRAKTSLKEQEENRLKNLAELDDFFDQVRAYSKQLTTMDNSQNPTRIHDLRLDAMLPFVARQAPIFVHAGDAESIQAAVLWADRQQVKIVIVGGYDAWRVADILKERDIPVIIEGVLRMPARRFEAYNEAYALAGKLYKAGVRFAISTGSGEAAQIRNLPDNAAMAAAFGLPADIALRSITLSAAEILGVQDRVGSLDIGKEATLFIASGDILEIPTQVEQAFIDGRKLDMNDRHKTLYYKYQEKYRQLGVLNEH